MIRLVPDIPLQARRWRNDPAINQWCRQNHLISIEQQEEWLKKINDDASIKMFGIYGSGKDPIGVAGLTSISSIHRHAEFSLYIDPLEQFKGYGKQALIELIKYGFYNIGLNRIWGEVFEKNPAMSMFLSVGFKKEGYCRQSYFKNGKFIDSEIISILRSEYDDIYGDTISNS